MDVDALNEQEGNSETPAGDQMNPAKETLDKVTLGKDECKICHTICHRANECPDRDKGKGKSEGKGDWTKEGKGDWTKGGYKGKGYNKGQRCERKRKRIQRQRERRLRC